ncbi:HEAT repeat domain-containing protein [Streptomyces fimicarius]|uniref:HEAT repeat domain-containing protein n=1 Tax=Streptomyces griseus TaxID=1911 RepID=UPI00369AD100
MRINVVFRDAISPRDFFEFTNETQWPFHGAHPATESAPAELTWSTPAGAGIHLIEDEALGIIYISIENYSIEGVLERDLQEAADIISERFEAIEPEELVDLYHSVSDWNEKVLALMMVAAAAGEQSEEICTVVKDGLRSSNPDVRKAAVIASMYTPWDDLKILVEIVAESDPDENTRDLAAASLANFA